MHPPGIPNPTRARYRKNCMYAFWGGHVGAAAGCCCRVLLQGAAAGCCCRVLLLLEWCARSKALQGAAARCCRCCSQSGVWNGHAGAAAGRVPAV